MSTATANPDVLARVAEFTQLGASAPSNGEARLDSFTDIPITLTARLGQSMLTIGDILKLGPGSTVPLDREVRQQGLVRAQLAVTSARELLRRAGEDVLTQAQVLAERHADLGMNLRLVHRSQVILYGIFDRADVQLLRVHLTQRRVQRRRLT